MSESTNTANKKPRRKLTPQEAVRLTAAGLVGVAGLVGAAARAPALFEEGKSTKPAAATAKPFPTATPETSTTTAPKSTQEEAKAYADGVERNKFNKELEAARQNLGGQIIDAFTKQEGNAHNSFSAADENLSFPEGYGHINVFFNVGDGAGRGEYGLMVGVVRNGDGTFDPSTIDEVSVLKQINHAGKETATSPGDRETLASITFDEDRFNYGGSNNLTIVETKDVIAGGDQIETLTSQIAAAQQIMNDARSGVPVHQ